MNNPVFRRAALAASLTLAAAGPAFATQAVWDTPLAVTGNAGTGNGAAGGATPWITSPVSNAIYAEWNVMGSETPPGSNIVDSTPDVGKFSGTSAMLTETGGAAFVTGGGNIYSFAAPTGFSLTSSGLAGAADVWLRISTLGTIGNTVASLNGVSATRVETFSELTDIAFGSSAEKEWYWKWSGVNAASYSFSFSSTESSMSLDQVGVFAAALAPVPEPGEWAMLAAGLALMGAVVRRKAKRNAA